MDKDEFFMQHGYRFCFYLFYNVVSFVPVFTWLADIEDESQHQWAIMYMILLGSGVFLPFMIEGIYMRKKGKTYLSQENSIRSFYLAPGLGLTFSTLIPLVYIIYLLCGPELTMFSKDNLKFILTVAGAFVIEMNAMILMVIQANRIRKQLMTDVQADILRSLQSIGSRSQLLMQSLMSRKENNITVDLSRNTEQWNANDFPSTIRECIVCCEAFQENDCPVIRMPCNPEKHFFHQKCIESWFSNNQNCPLCRTMVARIDVD